MAREDSLLLLAGGEIPERYQRNLGTLGIGGQGILLKSRVAVVGAGGLGGMTIELPARQGVGFIRIIDGDSSALHNLNRQLPATERTLGMNKAAVAAVRVSEINSDVKADAISAMFTEKNAAALLNGMDVVVDALDSIRSRLLLSRTAQELGIPLVHSAIAGSTGRIGTILPDGPGLEKVYGIKQAIGTKGSRSRWVLLQPPLLRQRQFKPTRLSKY
jgi:molybdopterin/thiamine biosynthesis adenylyltransferase